MKREKITLKELQFHAKTCNAAIMMALQEFEDKTGLAVPAIGTQSATIAVAGRHTHRRISHVAIDVDVYNDSTNIDR